MKILHATDGGSVVAISGATVTDDRGSVSFVNDFSFDDVRRFYIVRNHVRGFVRAWHGHIHEKKYVSVVTGAALVGIVSLGPNGEPGNNLPASCVLNANQPHVLEIPAGHANGFKTLTDDAVLLFFSTATLSESLNDDIRFDARRWDIWDTIER